MSTNTTSDDESGRWHRRFAVDRFNRTWDLIEKTDRSADDEIEMLLSAATSRWHWSEVGDVENLATGDWQMAHVASILGYSDLALTFASRNLRTAQAEGWTGWRLASANEAMARACAASDQTEERDRHVAEANRALEGEPDSDSAQMIIDQLATIPGRAPAEESDRSGDST